MNYKTIKPPYAFVIDMKQPSKEEHKSKTNDNNENKRDGEEQLTIECKLCNRKFIQESYEKHVRICGKVFQEMRDKFDTQKQRITELEQISYIKKQNNKKKLILEGTGSIKSNGNNPKGQKWDKKSEEFRQIVKMNKSHDKGFGLISNLTPNQKITVGNNNDDNKIIISATPKAENQSNSFRGDTYIECNLCKKKYTEFKYRDHRSDCKNKYKDLENKNRNKTKGMQITPLNTYTITSTNKCITDLGDNQGYQREETVYLSGSNLKPTSNWRSKPVLNLKFGKK